MMGKRVVQGIYENDAKGGGPLERLRIKNQPSGSDTWKSTLLNKVFTWYTEPTTGKTGEGAAVQCVDRPEHL